MEDVITISCPLCAVNHDYKLTVTRSIVVGMSRNKARFPTVQRRFVRLFICPVKKERFEAELTLPETALSRIREIEISEG